MLVKSVAKAEHYVMECNLTIDRIKGVAVIDKEYGLIGLRYKNIPSSMDSGFNIRKLACT